MITKTNPKSIIVMLSISLLIIMPTYIITQNTNLTNPTNKPIGYTYFFYNNYPSQGANTPEFANLIKLKLTYPNIKIIGVVNNGNGAGTFKDPNYVNVINAMRNVGIIVIGYIYCNGGYGQLPASRNMIGSDFIFGIDDQNRGLRQAIDAWASFYTLDGLFIDNAVPSRFSNIDQLNTQALGWPNHTVLQYYQNASDYARTKYGYTFIMDNVGKVYPEMIAVANTLAVEDFGVTTLPTPSLLKSWTTNNGGNPSNFNLIVYNLNQMATVNYLEKIQNYSGYISFSNGNTVEPTFDYQDTLLENLNQLNAQSTGLNNGILEWSCTELHNMINTKMNETLIQIYQIKECNTKLNLP